MINYDLLLRETLGDFPANVYKMQHDLNEAAAQDYHVAYSFGNDSAPLKIHNDLAKIGAKSIGIDLEVYLQIWEECVEVIQNYAELPEGHKDERYLINE